MAIKPYLQLVRLPNVFTAAADSLAGWLLVTGSLAEPVRWLPLVGASMATYAGGIVLNDLFDLEVDRVERPGRPLPSGQVTKTVATALALVFMALGMGLAVISGVPNARIVAAVLVACVVAYDAGVKRTILGPAVMGACRGLNLLLGMSASEGFGGPTACLVPILYSTFVAGITWISRSEAGSASRLAVRLGGLLQFLALVGYLGWEIPFVFLEGTQENAWRIIGLIVTLTTAIVIALRTSQAERSLEPRAVQRAVKTGIFSLIWLHVGVLIAVWGPTPESLSVALLWLPAAYLGRWIYST
jgi:4-hydroxybenzoate polyprenyltransferase